MVEFILFKERKKVLFVLLFVFRAVSTRVNSAYAVPSCLIYYTKWTHGPSVKGMQWMLKPKQKHLCVRTLHSCVHSVSRLDNGQYFKECKDLHVEALIAFVSCRNNNNLVASNFSLSVFSLNH